MFISLQYYYHKFGMDFRSLRFPGIISADTNPGGGTTGNRLLIPDKPIMSLISFDISGVFFLFWADYAVKIFHDALQSGHFKCYLKEDTMLPMMFIDDCLRSVVEFMETPDAKLKMRTYNVTAMSFTPDQIITEVRKFVPELKVTYEIDGRQAIGNYEFIYHQAFTSCATLSSTL